MKFDIRPIPGTEYVTLSDGSMIASVCPCCDKPMTLKAATKLMQSLEQGVFGVSTLADMEALFRAEKHDA